MTAPALFADLPRVPAQGRPLTRRQVEVLALVAEGYTDRRIGATLGVTVDRAKTLLGRAMVKLGAANRAHAVHLAHRAGVLS